MFGYIYLTTNIINKRMYIGKHKSSKYDKSYYGSGKLILQDIDKYGIENFSNEILFEASSKEELDEKEKYYIAVYREVYGENLYNIALGGDGGDTYSNRTQEEKDEFVTKMTKINRERCSSEEFKNKKSQALKEKYSNLEERQKQSEKIRKSWSDDKLRTEQSERLKEYYSTHKKDNSYFQKQCVFEFNGIIKEFESVKDLKMFLKQEYGYAPSNPGLKRLMIAGTQGIPFKSFKRAYDYLNGMRIYYKQNENVETTGDECNPVGHEIGTCSKCKAEIEEIVRSV